MNVKAQALLNAAKHVEERYGQDRLRDVLRTCSPRVRDAYTSAIAINWQPVEVPCEFMEVAAKIVGIPVERMAQDVGIAQARVNTRGTLLKIAFYVAKPELVMKRAAGLWRQFNDEGSLEILRVTDSELLAEVRDIRQPNATFCETITGWFYEMCTAAGVKNLRATHSECRARGGRRCMYQIRGVVPRSPPGA